MAGLYCLCHTKPFIVTIDLDSTLCDTGHRQHTIMGDEKDWVAYSMLCGDDELVEATAALILALADTHEIHYVSGRDGAARHLTEPWIKSKELPIDGLWLEDSDAKDHVTTYGSHAAYKLKRIRDVEEATGKRVVLHVDDWPEVKLLLEQNGIPCLCVRTPQEITAALEQERLAL